MRLWEDVILAPLPPSPVRMHEVSGRLQVVVDMVKNRLAEPDAQEQGWLLDGYPRSAEQAEAIEAVSIRPDLFILINVRTQRTYAASGRVDVAAHQCTSCC